MPKPSLAELMRRRKQQPLVSNRQLPRLSLGSIRAPAVSLVPTEPNLVPYGNVKAYEAIRRHMEGWESAARSKPLLIIGPSGVGKTFLVEQLAARMHLTIRRVGCSEMVLNKDLVKVFERALKNYDLLCERRCVVLLDSLDGLPDLMTCASEGKIDTKGVASHLEALLGPATRRPYRVFITVNDKGSPLIRKLASLCTQTWMNRPDRSECLRFAEAFLRERRLVRNDELVHTLANECLGDLRGLGNNILFYSTRTARTRVAGGTVCRDIGATPFDLCRDALRGVSTAVEQLATSAHELHYQILADNYLTLNLDETLVRVAAIADDMSRLHCWDLPDDYKEALTRDMFRLARNGAYPKQLQYDRNRGKLAEDEDETRSSPLERAFQNACFERKPSAPANNKWTTP